MITITHPGKLGDLLWALPTVRALAVKDGAPVYLWLSAACTPLASLLRQQPYISGVVIDESWQVQDTAPASPRVPPYTTGDLLHLGYPAWPTAPLPFYTQEVAEREVGPLGVDYATPWIAAPDGVEGRIPVVAWTDRWHELKVGVTLLVAEETPCGWWLSTQPGSRMAQAAEVLRGITSATETIDDLVFALAEAPLVLTDCSMTHVLAAAMGKTVVVVEPEPDRHHCIFWPGSEQLHGVWRQAQNPLGRRIFPVLGGDGKPTFDSRHTIDLVKEHL